MKCSPESKDCLMQCLAETASVEQDPCSHCGQSLETLEQYAASVGRQLADAAHWAGSVVEESHPFPHLAEHAKNALARDTSSRDYSLLQSSLDPAAGSDPAAETHPRIIGDFRIGRLIGRGGMGVVYQAHQQSLNRAVALKLLSPSIARNPQAFQRFEREAQAAASLQHPRIVPVYGSGYTDNTAWYAMQLIDGEGLDLVLAEIRIQRAGSDRPAPEKSQRSRTQKIATTLLAAENINLAPVVEKPGASEKPTASEVKNSTLLADAPSAESATIPPAPAPSQPAASSLAEPLASAAAEPRNRDDHQNCVEVRADSDTPRSAGASGSRDRASTSSTSSAHQNRTRKLAYFRRMGNLAAQVAGALAHAHDRGIVHRDIKPANLLLDTAGGIWVADFGLAKSEQDLHLTNAGDVVGTLRYLAPEQLSGITAASCDIYALGATLYEMTTLQPLIATPDRGQALEQIRRGNVLPPREIDPQVPLDLETIILKAVANVPGDRYPNAAALEEDLRRFVAGKPIMARPLSITERTWRWAGANRWLAASLTLLLLGLIGVAIGSTLAAFQFRSLAARESESRIAAEAATAQAEAAQGRERAARINETEQRRFAQAITAFVKDDFLALASVEGQGRFQDDFFVELGPNATLEDLLDRAANKLNARQDLAPPIEAELSWMIGVSFRAIGRLPDAVSFLRRAIELSPASAPIDPGLSLQSRHSLAVALRMQGRYAEAIGLFEENLRTLEQQTPGSPDEMLWLQETIALTRLNGGEIEIGLAALKSLVPQIQAAKGPDSFDSILALSHLASGLVDAGKSEQAIEVYQTIEQQALRVLGARDKLTLTIQSRYAALLSAAGQHQQAIEKAKAAADTAAVAYGAQRPHTLGFEVEYACCLRRSGQQQAALTLLEEVRPKLVAVLGETHIGVLSTERQIGNAYRQVGRFSEALITFETAHGRLLQQWGQQHPTTLRTAIDWAHALNEAGFSDQAMRLCETTLQHMEGVFDATHPDRLACLTSLAIAQQAEGRIAMAIAGLEEVEKIQTAQENPIALATTRNNLASAYLGNQQAAVALSLIQPAVESLQQDAGPNHPLTLKSQVTLAQTYLALGRIDESILLLQDTIAQMEQVFSDSHVDTSTAKSNLGFALLQVGRQDQAIALFQELVQQSAAAHGANTAQTLSIMHRLAMAQSQVKRTEAAIETWQTAIARSIDSEQGASTLNLTMMRNLGVLYFREKRWDDAINAFEQAVQISSQAQGQDHPLTLRLAGNLGINYFMNKQYSQAIDTLRPVEIAAINNPQLRFANQYLLEALAIQQQGETIVEVATRMAAYVRQKQPDATAERAQALSQIAKSLQWSQRPADAQSLLEEALEDLNPSRAPAPAIKGSLHFQLGQAKIDQQMWPAAAADLEIAWQAFNSDESTMADPALDSQRTQTLKRLIQVFTELQDEEKLQRYTQLRRSGDDPPMPNWPSSAGDPPAESFR